MGKYLLVSIFGCFGIFMCSSERSKRRSSGSLHRWQFLTRPGARIDDEKYFIHHKRAPQSRHCRLCEHRQAPNPGIGANPRSGRCLPLPPNQTQPLRLCRATWEGLKARSRLHLWRREVFLTAAGELNRLLQDLPFLGGEAGVAEGDQSHLLQSDGGINAVGKFRLGGVWVHSCFRCWGW